MLLSIACGSFVSINRIALFSSLIDSLEVSVEISMNPEKQDLLDEFADFAKNVILLYLLNPV